MQERNYLSLLVRCGDIIGESIDWHETLQNVCRAAVETVADICRLDLWQEGVLRQVAAAHRDPSKNDRLAAATALVGERGLHKEHSSLAVARGAAPVLVEHVDDAWIDSHAAGPQAARFAREMNYRSLIIVPIESKVFGTLGALTLVRTDGRAPYDDLALSFARDLARRCGTAIAKARLYGQMADVATRYQVSTLPKHLPHVDGFRFDAYYEPSSEELLVGGDWYDAFVLQNGNIAITIGDVFGHGIEAAVSMSRMRNALRAALISTYEANSALEIADEVLRSEGEDEYATALVAILDPTSRVLHCATAGHPGPLVTDPDGHTRDPFVERGAPLGMLDLAPRSVMNTTVTLEPGSIATFFTDGLIEWGRNLDQATRRLNEILSQRSLREDERLAMRIFERVLEGKPHPDDIAILTVQVL